MRDVARARRHARRRAVLVPMAAACLAALPGLGQGDFRVDTGWYAAIALQAGRAAWAGDLGGLWTLMGPVSAPGAGVDAAVPYFNKPPLAFWLHAPSLLAAGPELWAARLPSVAAFAACAGLTSALAARLCGRRCAMAAGLVMALTPPALGLAHAISLDLWMTVWVLWALVLAAGSAGRECRGDGAWSLAWAGVPLGLALLTKPLLGLLAIVPLGIWCAARAGPRATRFAALGAAALLGVLVALPWHASMVGEHGRAFLDQYLGREVMERAAGSLANRNRGSESPLYYPLELVRAYWPWLATVALAGVAGARGGPGGLRGRPGLRAGVLLWAWIGVWLVALTVFPDKRPRYLMPLYPAGSVLSAWWLRDAAPAWVACIRRAVERIGVGRAGRVAAGVIVAGTVAVALLPIRLHGPMSGSWTALLAHLRAEGVGTPERPLWEGGFDHQRGARLYLEFGAWPVPTRDGLGRALASPPAGALLVYHPRDGLAPGPGEVEWFRAEGLVVTRLERGEWRPVSVPDPGE